MKRFLYYNQDSINSLLAQIGQGLLLKNETGSEESNESSSSGEISPTITADLSAKVLGIGTSLKGELLAKENYEDVTSKMIHNVQEKVMHDYAFEKVLEHIDKNKLVNNDSPAIGDYVLIEELPTFLDFDYFEKMFGENGIYEFINNQKKKQVKDIEKSIPSGAKVPPELKSQIKALKDQNNTSEDERKDLLVTLEVIKNTLPYNRFILTDSMLIPLDDGNLRDDPSIVAFKYGGKMKMFGYVTNVISATSPEEKPNNNFYPFYEKVNKLMLTLMKQPTDLFIIHPIAIYY